mgnify:CR=1 FL=1
MENPKVYFDIEIAGKPKGKIIFELYAKIVPKSAENFRALCTHEKGFGYRGSIFFAIYPNFMIHGGDITRNNGSGGKSIYGKYFDDENFKVLHNKPGTLTMDNCGKNTNGSQFYITTAPCPWLDRNHVAIGRVIYGMEIVNYIETLATESYIPRKEIKIVRCGELI